MVIGIELRHVVMGPSGGVAQLLKGVLEHAFRIDSGDSFQIFCTVFNRGLLRIPEGARVTEHTLPLDDYWAEVDRLCKQTGVDVLFRGYPGEDTRAFPLERQIFQIPDMQHERHPEFFSDEILRGRRAAFTKALGGAGAIGTISGFSRRTILESPHIRCTDVFLMPPALQEDHQVGHAECTAAELATLPTRPYFVFPANTWPHKNHAGLIEGFRAFMQDAQGDHELVLTGHPEGWSALRSRCADLPVRHLGFVRPRLLRALLERALALTYFSLYEGFGMPLLEAFDAGTPVLCSNTTSLPEVGGDAVLMCDPTDPRAIASLMHQLTREPGLRNRLIERGRARLGCYTWAASAANLMAACQRVAERQGLRRSLSPTGGPAPSGPQGAKSRSVAESSQPLVSIVTPSYNQGVYLRRTIESVLSQSYPNIELIVMDGSSSDDSVAILKEYGERIQWVSEPDKGQTHAINKGMRRARGCILAYLNSDDVLLPDAVRTVVDYLTEHRDVALLYGKAFYIDQHDQITGEYKTEPYSKQRLAEECIVCQPATFWRRSLADVVGEFDESLHYVMDYDYWLRAANAGVRIDFVSTPLANSRRYPETKTLSARGKIYRELFATCWRHNRYIGLDYFIGYWHHVLNERGRWLALLSRLSGCNYVRLGHLHFHLVNRKRDLTDDASRAIRRLKSRLHRAMRGAPPAQFPGSEPTSTQVNGFTPDNRAARRLRISHPKHDLGSVGYLEGVAPVSQKVEVVIDGQTVETKCLGEGVRERVEVALGGRTVSVLEFVFSPQGEDRSDRHHAFLVEATNLFSEHHICS